MREVVVVGAGPAGGCAAALLARRGLDVLLFERARFPRDKLCGEFLSPDALAVLDGLGLLHSPAVASAPRLSRFRLSAPGGAELTAELARPGRGLTRRTLDTLLSERARELGAELVEGVRVLQLETQGGVHRLHLAGGDSVEARVVVDATGRCGLSAAAACPTERAERRAFVGFERHFTVDSFRDGLDRTVEIHAFPGGYLGLNRTGPLELNLCLLACSERLRSAAGPEGLLAAASRANPLLDRRLAELGAAKGHWLSAGGMSFGGLRRRTGPAFRVGDAAAMIAPVCGDGMAMALRSAELVAARVPEALVEPAGAAGSTDSAAAAAAAASALARYDADWSAEFGRRLRLGRLVQTALLRPTTARLLVGAGRLLPFTVQWLLRGTRDWPRACSASSSSEGAPDASA